MNWRKTDIGWMSERAAETPANLLVAILADRDPPPAALVVVAKAWVKSFPLSDFVIFDGLDDIGGRLAEALARVGLPPGRLLLVGMGEGGRIGLSLAFEAASPCAGVLVYDALPQLTDIAVPRNRKVKVRLVGYKADDPRNDGLLGEVVRHMGVLGIDARATQLPEPGLTHSSIRLGAAYLAELSAFALDLPVGAAGCGCARSSLPNEVKNAH